MINLQDWGAIRHAHSAEGESIRSIAKRLGISRDTVSKMVHSDEPPRYVRKPSANSFSNYEERVRHLLSKNPYIPATVIAERVGWTGSISWFRKTVARLRPQYTPADPADRLIYEPGEQMQCDLWFPKAVVPHNGARPISFPVLVMVLSYSRFTLAQMIPTRRAWDLVLGMWELLARLGYLPSGLLWDNEAGVGRRGSLTEEVMVLVGTLGLKITQTKPYDPETKGIVERTNGYLGTSFLPGRRFASPDDFNTQLAGFLEGVANKRVIRRLGASPEELVLADVKSMREMPSLDPLAPSEKVRLARDYYVRVAGNDYSVHPRAIGSFCEVSYNLEEVVVTSQNQLLARHRRAWGSGLTVTDPSHVSAASEMRMKYQMRKPLAKDEDLFRDLSEYDRYFGVMI